MEVKLSERKRHKLEQELIGFVVEDEDILAHFAVDVVGRNNFIIELDKKLKALDDDTIQKLYKKYIGK